MYVCKSVFSQVSCTVTPNVSDTCFWPRLRPFRHNPMPQLWLLWKVQLSPHHIHSLVDQNTPKRNPSLTPTLSLLSWFCSENTRAFTTSSLVLYKCKSWFLGGVMKPHACTWLCCPPWVHSDRVVVVALSILTWKWALDIGMDVDKAGPCTVHRASRGTHPR